MARKRHILILGGTAEAVALADAVARAGDIAVTYSLAGRTGAPRVPAGVTVRTGGFGGAEALAKWIDVEKIAAVVDATHPFARQIAANAATACAQTRIPRLKLLRPAWTKVEGDTWRETGSAEAAAALLAQDGGLVFLSIGRQELAAFKDHRKREFLIRTVDEIKAPPVAQAICLTGRGPFTLAAERDLLRQYKVDTLITKNAGGDATYAKIAAARELKMPVIMINRPPPPQGPCVETMEDARHWINEELKQEDANG